MISEGTIYCPAGRGGIWEGGGEAGEANQCQNHGVRRRQRVARQQPFRWSQQF